MIKNIIIFTLIISFSTNIISQDNDKNKQDSKLKFLTSFQDNSNSNNREKQDNQTDKILFNIRKHIIKNQDYFNDDIYKYGLDNLNLSNKKTILKYKYLEKEIKFTKDIEDLLPSMGSNYSAEYYRLIKDYDNVSAEEIVYKCSIQFSSLEKTKNSYEFILDNKLNVLRGSLVHLFK